MVKYQINQYLPEHLKKLDDDNNVNLGHWYISWQYNRMQYLYLHTDGLWRASIKHNKMFSGYYPSLEVAELALKEALGEEEVEYSTNNNQ